MVRLSFRFCPFRLHKYACLLIRAVLLTYILFLSCLFSKEFGLNVISKIQIPKMWLFDDFMWQQSIDHPSNSKEYEWVLNEF